MPPNQTPPNQTPTAQQPDPNLNQQQPGPMYGMQPNPQTPQQASSARGKKTLFVVVLLVLLLLAGGAYALLMAGNKKPAVSTSKNSADTNTTQTGGSSVNANQFTAASLSDYQQVCQGAMASNAAAYGGISPHPIVLMSPAVIGNDHFIESSINFKNQNWIADYQKPESVQLVGCFTRKSEAASTKTCELQDSNNKTVNIPLVPVVYTLTIYEAKTGKKLATKDVSGPATTCPYIATYNQNEAKIFGEPDPGQAEAAVTEFVTKNF